MAVFRQAINNILISHDSSGPLAVTDTEKRAFILLVGQPKQDNYSHEVTREIQEASNGIREHNPPTKCEEDHRRGKYFLKSVGFSHGLGRKVSPCTITFFVHYGLKLNRSHSICLSNPKVLKYFNT